jgi:hypothetical protein
MLDSPLSCKGMRDSGGSGRDNLSGDGGWGLPGDEGGVACLLPEACTTCNLELRLGFSKKGVDCQIKKIRER